MNLKRTSLFFQVWLIKVLRLPPKWFPKKHQDIYKYWTMPMLWVYIRSLGTAFYIDQPCQYTSITDQPKTSVDPKYGLTSEEILDFHKKGFSGPHTLCLSLIHI